MFGHHHNGYYSSLGGGGHHHHHGGGLGLGLGAGIGLGLLASSWSTPSYRTTYVYTPPPPPPRVPTEAELREAREREERERLAEIERNRRHQEHMAQQAKDEEERLKNYDVHYRLIYEAKELSYPDLISRIANLPPLDNPIDRFRNTSKKGLPCTLDKENIFTTVLRHAKLSTEEKQNTLNLLNNCQYGSYSIELLNSPTLDDLIADKAFLRTLQYTYENYITERRYGLSNDDERKIWTTLLKSHTSTIETLFNQLRQSAYCNANRFLRFAHVVLNNAESETEVMENYKTLKGLFVNVSKETPYDFYIKKMAKQHMLALELDSVNGNQSKEERQEAEKFFKEHRSSLLTFTFLRTTKSNKIHTLIQSNELAKARHDVEKEERKLETDIAKRFGASN